MEFLKPKRRISYYRGELLMFDGIRDGKAVHTFLSEVVLIRLPHNLYMNERTKEHYVLDNTELKEGDIACKIQEPLINLKDSDDVVEYILSSPLFFKDRIDIYMQMSDEERKKFNDQILKDIDDNTKYHRIIKEQGPIVRAYAKIKR